jgi:hypothetical protein
MLAQVILSTRTVASGLVPRGRLVRPRLTHRHNVEKHGDHVPWLGRIWLGHLMQFFDTETSLLEGLRVSLKGTVFPVEGHNQVVMHICARATFFIKVRSANYETITRAEVIIGEFSH